jgi:hypothetical protein
MGGGPTPGDAGAGAADVEALLREFPALGRTEDGRVKCSLTGHVMHAKPEVVRPYVQGKRFAQASAKARAMDALKQFEPHIVRSKFLPDKLFCRITGRYLAANERAVEQHSAGRRFERGVEALSRKKTETGAKNVLLTERDPTLVEEERREEAAREKRKREAEAEAEASNASDAKARAAKAAAKAAAAEAAASAARATETAERARLEAASAQRELEKARQARAETAAEKARQRATLPLGEPQARREDGERPTTTTRRALSTQPYSAAEASRKGREGSGWFDALGETAPAARARSNPSSAAPPPPWLLGAETESPSSGGDRITGRAAAPAARDARPFATADSFATWSSHVASAEARLMALSQERDQLEGELSRMPEGSGRTIEQRRKKANAEKRLDEVLKASSAARHQLKAANRNLGHAAV